MLMFKSVIKKIKWNLVRKIINRLIYSVSPFEKKLHKFLKQNVKNNKNSKLILFWDLGGFSEIMEKNAIFSMAFNMRGYNTHFIVCDGSSQACMQRGLDKKEKLAEWDIRCKKCFLGMKNKFLKYKAAYSTLSNYITDGQKRDFETLALRLSLDEIVKYIYFGVNVGELAMDSFNRYMKGFFMGLAFLNKEDEMVFRKYFYGALVNTHVANNVFLKLNPSAIVTSHGVYIDYATIITIGLQHGIPSTSWHSGYADFLHYFTVSANGMQKIPCGVTQEEWEEKKKNLLSVDQNNELDNYFSDRYFGKKARDIVILESPKKREKYLEILHITNKNPIVCLFAHVNWDACFDKAQMVFQTSNEWILASLKVISNIDDVNWLIRLHPGEYVDGSLFTTADLIKKYCENIPDNIKIIYPDSGINSYGIFDLIDVGITALGTVGVELPPMGKPVITIGDAHYSSRGFTIDVRSKKEYFSYLNNIRNILPLTAEQIALARCYAYSYFIERQMLLDVMDKKGGHWGSIDISKLEELLPGKNATIDKICNGIINGTDVQN